MIHSTVDVPLDLQNIGRVVVEYDVRTDGEVTERCGVSDTHGSRRDETQCVVELNDVTRGVAVNDRLFKRRLYIGEPPAVAVKLPAVTLTFAQHVPDVRPERGGVRENDHLIGIRLDRGHGLEIGHEVRQRPPSP